MLRFKISDTSRDLILTLTELTTEATPDYLFVFTNVLTKQEVTFTKTYADDLSNFKSRYNKFNIDPSVLFADKEPGEWHYSVYQNDANGVLLEQGKMILDGATDFDYDKYNSQTSFKTYNG
jgi:hypothetical protein